MVPYVGNGAGKLNAVHISGLEIQQTVILFFFLSDHVEIHCAHGDHAV